jgi:chromosome segregation ATPase
MSKLEIVKNLDVLQAVPQLSQQLTDQKQAVTELKISVLDLNSKIVGLERKLEALPPAISEVIAGCLLEIKKENEKAEQINKAAEELIKALAQEKSALRFMLETTDRLEKAASNSILSMEKGAGLAIESVKETANKAVEAINQLKRKTLPKWWESWLERLIIGFLAGEIVILGPHILEWLKWILN